MGFPRPIFDPRKPETWNFEKFSRGFSYLKAYFKKIWKSRMTCNFVFVLWFARIHCHKLRAGTYVRLTEGQLKLGPTFQMNSNQETNIVSCWRKKNKSWRGIGLLIKGLTLAVSFEDKIVRNLFYLPPPCVVWQAKGYQVTRVALKQSQPFLAWFSTISILHNHPVHHLSNLLLTSANFYRMPLSAVLASWVL